MCSSTLFALAILGLAWLTPASPLAQERDRSSIPDQCKWHLADLYPTDSAYQEAVQKFIDELPAIQDYRGTLSSSANRLAESLDVLEHLNIAFTRLFTYVTLSLDQDMRMQSRVALKQQIDGLGATLGEQSAFIEPEILAIDSARLLSFLTVEKKLAPHRHYLTDLLRRTAHIGSDSEERILANAELLGQAPSDIRDQLIDADLPYPRVTLSDGTSVKLDEVGYSFYRRSPNRADRKIVLQAYLGRLDDYRRTFGALLDAQIAADLFYMKSRKYSSCLESSLDDDNIPVQVYHNLVGNVSRHLVTFQRYLTLRQRMLGVDELHYFDLSAPLAVEATRQYTYQEAQAQVLAACKPLGGEYGAIVEKAFTDHWIDWFPTEGKRSGGYSNGWAYAVHPYILLNYTGTFEDISGLAHELGHAVQSYYSNTHQPFTSAACPRFTVEVASTFNEALLVDHMLRQSRDTDARLAMLSNYLDSYATTIFRAALISEFELRIHSMAEHGEQLTGDKLDSLYIEITRKYYGHDKGICIVDDEVRADWIRVPQLYSQFYAYQYATAFTASAALEEMVLSGDKAAQAQYLDFLASGGSDYAIPLLKKAGVDMTTPEPFELCMKKMNYLMDEMEKILNKKG